MPPRNEDLQEIEDLKFLFSLLSTEKKNMLIGFARFLSEKDD